MFPKICCNCTYARNVGNEMQLLGTICKATPFDLFKAPDNDCGLFQMAEVPVFSVPDAPEAAGTNESGQVPQETQDSALDGVLEGDTNA